MSGRTVYYFCTRHLRGGYNELVCQRITRDFSDPTIDRLQAMYATGMVHNRVIHKVVYPCDADVDFKWEKEQLMRADPADHIKVVTIELA